MNIGNDITLVAAADWWQILAGIIFFVLYGLGQLLGAREDANKKQPRPRPPRPPRPPAGQPGAPGAPPNQADPLRAEVEEFLRRAQGQQAEPRRPAQPQAAPPPRQISPQRPMREATSRPAQSMPQPPRPPVKPLQPKPIELRQEGVAEHVARHVSTQDITEHASTLGAEVALADDRLEARLQETFQHPIGQLQHNERNPSKQQPLTIAEEIRQLIRQPAGARQLILANEILHRPEERWQ